MQTALTAPLGTALAPRGSAAPLAALLAAGSASSRSVDQSEAFPPARNELEDFVEGIPDWSRPIIAVLVALVLVLWLRSALASRRARRLARRHARVVDDLALLQSALVPPVPPQLGGLAASVAYRPADGPGAGGDFYDAFELGDGRVAIIAGDASGHGREAIVRATAVRYRLRAYLELGLSPREALRAAGRAVAADADGAFATAVLAAYDAATGVLTYACAGHPPPIVSGKGQHSPVTTCSAPPIGWGLATGVRQTSVRLGEGSLALFFTDGMVEARSGGEMLGRERLAAIVAELDGTATAAAALDGVRDLADQASDDMAALLLRAVGGTAASEVRVEELELDGADLRRGFGELFLDALGLDAQEILRAMRVVHLAARAGHPVLLRVEVRADGLSVEALERLGEEVTPPPFIPAATDSRVDFARHPTLT